MRGQIQIQLIILNHNISCCIHLFLFCNFFSVEECKDVKYSLLLIFQDMYGVLCNKNDRSGNKSRAHHKALKATWSLQVVCLTGLHLTIWQTEFVEMLWNIPIPNVKLVLSLLSSRQNPNINFLQPSFSSSTFYKKHYFNKRRLFLHSVTTTSQSHVSIMFFLLILEWLNIWLYRVVLTV